MGREARVAARLNWHRVTNELVCSFAAADCKACCGDGIDESGGVKAVCECARAAFRKEYMGRVRWRAEHGRRWMEYRDLVAVPA